MTSPGLGSDERLGDRRDVGALYERYARRLLAFLGGLGVPPRHHDVWVRVCKALEQAPFKGHFRGWLFRIARNLVADRECSPGRDAASLSGPADRRQGPRDAPPGGPPLQETTVILQRCLAELGRLEGAVFALRAAGDSYDDVCARLGLDRATAYRLSCVATKKLACCKDRASRPRKPVEGS